MITRKQGTSFLALVLAVIMLLTMMPVQVQAASSSEIRQQIKELKSEKAELQSQIDSVRKQYQQNENEMLDMVNQKNVIDQEISILISQIENINAQIASYSLLIADKQDELDEAQTKLNELSEKNKERIQAMEEEGTVSYWEVLFKSNSFSDLLDRLNMIQEIAASDKRRIEEMAKAAEEVAMVQEELTTEKQELEVTRAELDTAQEELEVKRQEADEILRELIAKGEEFELLIEEGEAEQELLMAEIAAAEKELKKAEYQEWLATYVPPTTRPAGNSGSSGGGSTAPSTSAPSSSGWVCPLSSYTLTSPFGMRKHPISGKMKMHNGVDMAAPQGTPIYAAKSGKVTAAAWQSSMGYYVSINHGDGFASIYMHMTHYIVSPGTYVNAGQVIGYVGSTGSSTGNHLHFGISYNGAYVNPMQYI